jgi:hypothetical protein
MRARRTGRVFDIQLVKGAEGPLLTSQLWFVLEVEHLVQFLILHIKDHIMRG